MAKKSKKVAESPTKRNIALHAKHPVCERCGKALYKWMGNPPTKIWVVDGKEHKGKNDTGVADTPPKIGDSYAWCRNKACPQYSVSALSAEKIPPPTNTKERKATSKRRSRRGRKTVIEAPNSEPEVVRKARERIRAAVASSDQYSHNIIGLALTVVAQEMGGHDIANQFIDEYDLTTLFGIQQTDGL